MQNNYTFVFYISQDTELAAAEGNATGPSRGFTYVTKSEKASFGASAEERFGDALASLDYLLLREAPRVWSAVRRNFLD